MPRRLSDSLINDEEDGLPLLTIKNHTHEKLLCLLRHYAFFTRIVNARSPQRRRWYVDLFSGPGKCRTEETGEIKKGSPLIALSTQPPFTNFVFVEKQAEYLNALKQRTALQGSKCRYLLGDANSLLNEIVVGINDYDPCLVFLDPFELELDWNTVAGLAKKPRIDLMINFQVSQIFRSFGLQSYDRLDRFFGPNDWRPIERRWNENVPPDMIRSELFELYTAGLERHGLRATPKLVYTESTNLPLYYLIYAVRFPVGEKVWKEIAKPKISRYRTLDGHEVTLYE
jgi:three-Cys-motif partner protein